MEASALDVKDLTVTYDATPALRGVTFELAPESTMAVIGPNGSGKSSLLRAIVGLVPYSGSVSAGSRPITLVLQSTDVDRSVPITVRETVAMARYASTGILRRFNDHDREAVFDSMVRLDVAGLAERQLHELSGGQRQRVLVAQGLAQEANIVLLDEPITGLDMASREHILNVIVEEQQAGHTVVMTTHNLEDARRCDVVLLLATHTIAMGTPDEVLQEGPLRAAFGGRVLATGDDFVLDDPHHAH